MKILLINDYGIPVGGAEIQVLRLREELRKQGHDARLFTSSAESGDLICDTDYKCLGTTSFLRTALQTVNLSAYWNLKKVLGEFNPDVVHVKIFLTQLSPLILPLLKKYPTLYHVAWYRPICPTGFKVLPQNNICTDKAGAPCYTNGCLSVWDYLALMFQLNLFNRWQSAFDLILTNSKWVKNRLITDGMKVDEVLYYGIKDSVTEKNLTDHPSLAFVGRLVHEKGVHILLQAFAKVLKKIPDAELLIAGDGPERSNIEKQIAELDISSNVSMLGYVKPEELDSRLKGAWCQVVPSIMEEPFGIVTIEAMMRSTPVIASSLGGSTELIDEGKNGFLFPPGDANTLADKLLEILLDRKHTETLGDYSRSYAESRFSDSIFIDNIISIYERLLSIGNNGS